MKCIQNITTRAVERVKDAKAAAYVADGSWQYVPKSVWKQTLDRVRGDS